MKKIMFFKQAPVFYVTIWWLVFLILSLTNSNPFQLLNIIGFLFLIIVPGGLTVLALRLRGLDFWGYAGLIAGFSLLELMIMGLLGNTILPFFGINQPLEKIFLLWELFFIVVTLLIVNWARWETVTVSFKKFILFDNLRDAFLAFFPVVFVLLSIFGAIRLNNEGSNVLTMIMLGSVSMYLIFILKNIKKIDKNAIATILFFISIAFLLMTSLRGWYVTGHDVQREYMTFELAKNIGRWSMEAYRDSYNACLSITILPTIFHRLLSFFDPYVYKVIFQIIFAIVPSIIFLIFLRYVSKSIALVGSIYFIAFPTFFGDMPMLNRQEIAFLFLSLMLYVIFKNNIDIRLRRTIFVLFGIGMILSHYSTTYTVIAVLLFLIAAHPIFEWIATFVRTKKLFPNSKILEFNQSNVIPKRKITLTMVVFLALASFIWSSILTDTASGSISKVIIQTMDAIRSNAGEDAQSSDVKYSIFSWSKIDPGLRLRAYQENIVNPARVGASPGTYYEEELFEKYPIEVTDTEKNSLTWIGNKMNEFGVNVFNFNYIFRQTSAKILQLLFIIGFIYSIIRSNFFKKMDTEFVLMTMGSGVFVFTQVILPVLSVQYGVLRAFQQSLMFFGIFIVVGSMVIFLRFRKSVQICLVGILVIIFLLSSTSFISQITGGYLPAIHLSNAGTYYNLYYAHDSEVGGINWLQNNVYGYDQKEYQSSVQTDRYTSTKIVTISDINPLNDIYPGLIRKNSYVFLGFANIYKKQVTIIYSGDLISHTYPIEFVNENKNLIYSNDGSRIYK